MAGTGTTGSNITGNNSIQISAMSVSLKHSARGMHSLKLVVNGETKHERSFEGNELKLRCEFKPAFILPEKSDLTIRYARKFLLATRTRVEGALTFGEAQNLLSQASGECKNHKLRDDPEITIDFASSNDSHLAVLLEGAEVLGEHKGLLDRLGRSRKFFESLLGLGTAISELDPSAKAVLGCVNVVYKHLQAQELRHKSLFDLVENLVHMLGYVEDVQQFARLKEFKKAIEDVRPLVEDTTNFIIKYSSRGELAKTAGSFISSSDEDQVTGLKTRFELFKQRFDRGVSVQTAGTVEMLLALTISNRDDNALAKLKPMDDCGPCVAECMEGTRLDILAKINSWVADVDAPNILWLKGHPGVGKSAIASSLVEQLHGSMRLGSSFFFRRERAAFMTPSALWRTVAYDLARQYPTVKQHLAAALNTEEINPNTVNIDQLFRQLIREPLMASEDIPTGRLPIVVIDALDECGGLEGHSSDHRRSLMRTLERWSQLSGRFKLVVTGRGENDIERLFSTTRRHLLEIHAGQEVDHQSSEDVRKLLERRFRDIAAPYRSLPSNWPGDQTLAELTKRAAGLFIWVETVAKFVNRGEPQEQLSQILNGSGAGGIVELYSWILNRSFQNPSARFLNAFHSVVGTIILAKTPFSAQSLQHFLSVEGTMVDYICNGLQSVLDYRDTLRIKHQSFVDFMVDQNGCPATFFVDRERSNRNLTLACLRVMKNQLRFNICDFRSSYLRNADIPDLASRVEERIPTYVTYASYFWAHHLAETTFDLETLEHLRYFMQNQFLFWLEVLSLTKRVNLGSNMLRLLINWTRTHGQDDAMATDMQKFVAAFASVVSQSVPHIYLSALPFSPRNSMVSKQYMKNYPQTFAIQTGGPGSWPAIQNVLIGHGEEVNSVVLSSDGRFIASGSDDSAIRVWDAETGEMVAEFLRKHDGGVTSVAFSPDGRRIASGSQDTTILVWDAETGEAVIGPLRGHKDWIRSVAFSPDGRHIVSASDDGTIRVWDAETGEMVVGPLRGHGGWVLSVAFSPDGRRVVSGSDDRTIRVWDAQTGEVAIGPLDGHTEVYSVAFSPDGKRIASGSSDKTIRVWDAETGEIVAGPFKGHNDAVKSVAFSPDGRKVVSGSNDQTIRVWDAEAGALVAGPLEGHLGGVTSVTFSSDGRRVVSGSEDKTIRVWDAETGGVVTEPLNGHTGVVRSVSFSPDRRRIVSGSEDKTIRVWDAQTGEVAIGPLDGHTEEVYSVAFSPDGKRIASGSDNTIRVWDAETGEVVAGPFKGHNDAVNSIAFSSDGRKVVSGSSDHTIRVWDAETGEVVAGPFEGHTNSVASVTFSPDGQRVASGSHDRTIRVWDAETGEVVIGPLRGHKDWIQSVAFSPDGRHVVSASDDGTIRVWDAETGEMVVGPLRGHGGWVLSVAFSPDGRRVVSGSEDKTIRVWDAQTGEGAIGPLDGHTEEVHSVAFSPDGRYIVSGSADRTIRVWNLQANDSTVRSFNDTNDASSCSTAQFPTNPINALSIFSDNSKIEDGWILGSNSVPLIWVPPWIRTGLLRPSNTLIIGRVITTRLDFKHFVHGESWPLCKRPL